MLATKTRNANIGVGVGFVIELVGTGLLRVEGDVPFVLGRVVYLIGIALCVWGCVHWCQAKGHWGILGLLGILSCVGFMIILSLPDKYETS
jgi:hypothetical protein